MSVYKRLAGIVGNILHIGGPNGPAVKANGVAIEARNATDSAYAIARGLAPVASNDLVTLGYFDSHNAGSYQTTWPETTTLRSISLTAVAGQQIYTIPINDYFHTAAGETEVVYNGVTLTLGAGYVHATRNMNGSASTAAAADTGIGIVLAAVPHGGEPLVIRWKQRIINVAPTSLALVYCSGTPLAPNYNSRWNPSYPPGPPDYWNSPNAVRVGGMPSGYVAEFWRLSRRVGGAGRVVGGVPRERNGTRFLPYYRGPDPTTSDPTIFMLSTFDCGTSSARWRQFKYCFYNTANGARSALSSETIMSFRDNFDQHSINGGGGARYNSNQPWTYSLRIKR